MVNPKKLCMGCMNEKTEGGVCPVCGYNPNEHESPNALKTGTVLAQRYLVGRVIEYNGEGFTYIGFDLNREIVLRIREFFPAGLAERGLNNEVKILEGNERAFNSAIIKFLEMSKTLYKLRNLPAILPITDITELNGTAYRIHEFANSITLREFLIRNGGTLSWEQARPLFIPLISSVRELHENGIIHRGLSPETMLVGKDGKMRLIGFCTADARTAHSSLTAQLFPGFAAIEQYGSVGKQGTWTDVYGFAAVLYRTLVGSPPPEATYRLENDDLSIPNKVAEELPENVIDALCCALQLLPNDRIDNNVATMEELRALLISTQEPPKMITKKAKKVPENLEVKKKTATGKPKKSEKGNKKGKDKKDGKKSNKGIIVALSVITALAVVGCAALGYLYFKNRNNNNTASSEVSSIESVESNTSSKDPTKVYEKVDDFSGLTYEQIMEGTTLDGTKFSERWSFKIVGKAYSDSIGEGKVCKQSPAAGEEVPLGTTIELTVSLGPDDNVMVPNVIGKTENDAKIELMRSGFSYDNISVEKRLTGRVNPGCVIEVSPAVGTRQNEQEKITLYVEEETAVSSEEE